MRIAIAFWAFLIAAAFGAEPRHAVAEAAAGSRSPDRGAAAALDTGPHLVGWWKFDETSGKKAVDSSTQHHDGVLEGGLAFDTHAAPGRIGSALRLEGKESVRINGFKGVTGTRPRTVAVWIKTASPSGEIVSWGLSDYGRMWTLGFIRARVGVTPKGGYLYMKAATSDDAWHHVAAVVREASPPNLHDDVKLYKDGLPAEIDDIGLLDLWPIDTGDQEDVRIGQRYKGLLDDLRIYDRALSDEEIKTLSHPESDPLAPPRGEKGSQR